MRCKWWMPSRMVHTHIHTKTHITRLLLTSRRMQRNSHRTLLYIVCLPRHTYARTQKHEVIAESHNLWQMLMLMTCDKNVCGRCCWFIKWISSKWCGRIFRVDDEFRNVHLLHWMEIGHINRYSTKWDLIDAENQMYWTILFKFIRCPLPSRRIIFSFFIIVYFANVMFIEYRTLIRRCFTRKFTYSISTKIIANE